MMDTKLFWRLYFWWGIRQAGKRRIAQEKRNQEFFQKYLEEKDL
jgi:hypothetical protein